MTTWAGLGMNYGSQVGTSSYDTNQVEHDFTYLQQIGITRIRIAMPDFDTNATLVSHCQDMVSRALAHGFYVVWGVVVGFGPNTITATRWAASKTYIINTLAPWAQSVGLSELSLGNEDELNIDGTTITAATVRSDIRAMATTVKTNGFTGKTTYSTSILSTYRTPWISEGIGTLDFIAWNSYDNLGGFQLRNPIIVAAFGQQTYISEFGSITNGGLNDYASESAWYTDVIARMQSMRNNNVSAGYFFCWRDGNQGVPLNSFGLIQTTNGVFNGPNYAHYALRAVSGTKMYALRVLNRPVSYGIGITTPTPDSVALSDTIPSLGTLHLPDDTVALAETVTLAGKPASSENVQLSEDTITFSNTVGTVNAVQLLEAIALSSTTQFDPDVAPLLEVLNPVGQIQSAAESVQLSDTASVPPIINRYALRTFGSPVRYGSSAIVIPAESVSLIEQVVLAGTSVATKIAQFLDAETVAVSDALVGTGQTQIAADQVLLSEILTPALRYALRAFGAPVLFASAGSTRTLQIVDVLSVSLSESSTISNQTAIIDTVPLDETGTLTEIVAFTETVTLFEVVTEAGNFSAAESAQLSDVLQLANVPSLSESVQIFELLFSLVGTFQSTESTQLAEVLTNVNITSFTETSSLADQATFAQALSFSDNAALQEVSTFAAIAQFTESAQITEILASTSLSGFIESLALSDQATSFVNASTLIETVSLDETSTLSGTTVLSSETVQLFETLAQLILLQLSEAVALLDSSAYVGQSQMVDSAQSNEVLALTSTSQIASETTQLADIFSLTGQPLFIENVSVDDLLSAMSATMSLSDMSQLLEVAMLLGAAIMAAETVSLTESQALLSILALLEVVQLLETLTSSAMSMSVTESASLAEIQALLSTYTPADELVQIAEFASWLGLPTSIENVAISETSLFSGQAQNAAEAITLAEILQLVELLQSTESLSLLDSVSVAGVLSSNESALVLEIATWLGLTRSSDSVNLLEILGTPRRYALRSLGAPVRLKVSTNVLSVTDSVTLSESQAQAGSSQQVETTSTSEAAILSHQIAIAETVVVAETLQDAGATSTVDSVQCAELSTFLEALSQTETVALVEALSSQIAQLALNENVLLAEVSLLSETASFTETIQVNDSQTSVSIFSQTENVSLTETLSSQVAQFTSIESILLTEATLLRESINLTDAIQMSDSQTQIGFVTSIESIQVSEVLLLVSNTAFIVTALLSEQINLAESLSLQAESVLLAETFSSLTVVILQVPADSVALSEIFALSPQINMTFYVRKGNVALYVRKGSTTFYTRKGNVTFYERE